MSTPGLCTSTLLRIEVEADKTGIPWVEGCLTLVLGEEFLTSIESGVLVPPEAPG